MLSSEVDIRHPVVDSEPFEPCSYRRRELPLSDVLRRNGTRDGAQRRGDQERGKQVRFIDKLDGEARQRIAEPAASLLNNLGRDRLEPTPNPRECC